jgi:hypothetical protein
MQLIEVTDKQTRNLFHKVPHLIYKDDPDWACPLEGMIENTFTPGKNSTFKNGIAIRWILKSNEGEFVGRIAAFINFNKAKTYDQPTGGCGFFECINSQEAANILFDAAREWNRENGMEAMDGPINFGENYMNWGLLVEGFMTTGYGMPYNPRYYKALFENYGFQLYFKQYNYHLDYSVPFPERFWKIAGWVAQKPGYSFKHFDFKETDTFIQFHEHFIPLNPKDLHDFIVDSKPILDPEMIWFAYHLDEPIALFVMIPDLNQILKKLNGKLNLAGIIKFFYFKSKHIMTRTRILIMGVVPKYQRSGIESAIFWHQDKFMKHKPWYKEVELSWAGDFNPKIVSLYESVGGKLAKVHYTYRFLFDRTKPFKRAPIIGVEEKSEKK